MFLFDFPKFFTAFIIKIYQKTISLDHGILRFFYSNGYCRFHPTCSEYARQAILRFGVFKGGFLATYRLLRCQPWSKGGVDEVPGIKKSELGGSEEESKEGNDLSDQDFSKIVELYKKQIIIPSKKTIERFILCPIGLVGSGKTTVIKPLAEYFGLIRISGDEIRKLLKENGFNFARTVELGFGLAEYFMEKDFGVAVDSDCAGAGVVETIQKIADKRRIKVFLIHINTPEDFILENIKKFRPDAEVFIKDFYKRKPLHKDLIFPFVFTFDLSKGDVVGQIERCERVLEEKISKST